MASSISPASPNSIPGAMRHRVTLESRSAIIGDGGRQTVSYPAIATIWASIEPKAHAPVIRSDQIEYPVSHRITTRYAAVYAAARRITLGTRIFWVRSVINPGERGTFLIFDCEEGTVTSI